jgi:predicted DNA binding protein
LRVWLPKGGWASELSKSNPSAVFTVISRLELGSGKSLVELVIQSPEVKAWDDELRRIEGVLAVSKVTTAGQQTCYRVVSKNPWYVAVFHQLDLMWLLPIIIMDGMFIWKVLGADENIRMLVEELRRQSLTTEVEDIRPASTDSVVDFLRHKDELIRSMMASSREDGSSACLPKDLVSILESAGKDETENGGEAEGGRSLSDKLVICRLRVVVPEQHWLYSLCKKFPASVFDIMANLDLDNGERWTDVRIRSVQPMDWITELRAVREVMEAQIIGTVGNTVNARVKVKKHSLFDLLDKLNILWRLPCPVKNGVFSMVVTGSEKNIRHMLKTAKAGSVDVSITAVIRGEESQRCFLTPRQTEVFGKAVAAGYFEVPRLITLTELAAEMKVSGSSLSEMLAVVEKKLVRDFEQTNPT